MSGHRTWWGWGSYDTDAHYEPRSQIEALEAPILEGSDPFIHSPGYLLTQEQIQNTRLDAIVSGGLYRIARSELVPGQATEIGAYWRRRQTLDALGPDRGDRIAARIGAIQLDRSGLRFSMTANDRRPARGGPTRARMVQPRPDGTFAEGPSIERRSVFAPKGGMRTAPASTPAATTESVAESVAPTPSVPARSSTQPGRLYARPWPLGRPKAAPLPPAPSTPARRDAYAPSAPSSTTPAAPVPPTGEANAPTAAETSTSVGPATSNAGPDEQLAALAELEAILAELSTLTDEALAEELRQNPDLVLLFVELGYLDRSVLEAQPPTEIGAACCEDCAKADAYEAAGAVRVGDFWADVATTAAQVDQQVLSPVWEGVKEFVPYGQQFDQLHRARVDALARERPDLYPQGASTQAPAQDSRKAATIRDLQTLSRGVRRGEPQAETTAKAMKDRASSGDPEARRRWAAYVAISMDDDRRIIEGRS